MVGLLLLLQLADDDVVPLKVAAFFTLASFDLKKWGLFLRSSCCTFSSILLSFNKLRFDLDTRIAAGASFSVSLLESEEDLQKNPNFVVN